MIRDLKTGFKLMKYGAQYTYNIVAAIIIFVIGIVVEITTHGTNFIGGFYFLLVGVFPMQLVYSVDVATMVQSSDMKRKIQITIPVLMNAVIMTVVFAFFAVARIFEVQKYPEDSASLINMIYLMAAIFCIFEIYMGIIYKHFFVGMVVFLGPFFVVYTAGIIALEFLQKPISTLPVALVVLYLAIMGGIGIQYVLLRAFYKDELSKYAFGTQIRKLMK